MTKMQHDTQQAGSQHEVSHIVLIDDDIGMADMLSKYLAGEGFAVKHAETAAAGLHLACEPSTVLVLLDVVLSDRDGFSVLGEIRNTSRVPVIMLTMQDAVADRVKGLEGGADDYVPKPFTPIEVLARIRSVLRRNQEIPKQQQRLFVDDLTLVTSSRTVLRGRETVGCTAGEFEVLQLLVGNAGCVVMKEELTRAALGRTSYSGDRGVDNLIHSLRKKLGPRTDGGERFKAARNAGYVYLDRLA